MSEKIRGLRDARVGALTARGAAAARVARARVAAAEGARRGAADKEQGVLETELGEALAALRDVRDAERKALDAITASVAELAESPIERIDGLDASHPVALFPVRLETRFRRFAAPTDQAAGELLVRIYPDALLAQLHEPLLTDVEVAAGEAYWRRVFAGTPEADSWTLLLGEADAGRAAWIVETTSPTNLDALDPIAEPPPDPAFPALETRPPGWHRAPEALLPDRWIVTTYQGAVRRQQVFGAPVREGLALTLRLSADDEGLDASVDVSGDGLEIDPELRWAYDFDEAVAAGMAVRIPVAPEDLRRGFSTVLATGVRTTASADDQAGELEGLLDGHRVSRGLALLPQGTPTNNSADEPSGYPLPDPAGSASFAVARGAPLAAPGTDGHRFARALGVDASVVDHVAGADRDEQTRAAAMIDALWPATIGYFLTQLMAPHVDAGTRDAMRAYMREHVRPRGPYPAFRVGSVPYGLLPVSALQRWRSDRRETDATTRWLAPALARLERLWETSASPPPHVGRSSDPDADLVETLGQDASAQIVQIRRLLGRDTTWNVLGFLGLPFDQWQGLQEDMAASVLDAMGASDWDPRLLHLTFADAAYDFGGPLVQKEPLSESDPLVFDYVAWLRTAAPASLRNQLAPPTEEPLDALLYLMLRHALLAEYDASAIGLLDWRGLASQVELFEAELVEILPDPAPAREAAGFAGPQIAAGRTAWDRFGERIPGVTGDLDLGAFLADPKSVEHARAPEARAVLNGLAAYRDSLQALERLPSAELERLFTETLDTCSHRLDAWITSLYAQRLELMRAERPRGAYIGCYGWVQNLLPDPEPERVPVTGRDGAEEQARTDSGGHVYAPSMMHGATAAVLRSAYLTRANDASDTYAVDLSSARVRTALSLLDSVRDNQPLGSALGYRFERGLHEGHPGVELDEFIDEFRALYPIVANKAQDSGESAESVAARNVVDGLRLRTAWRAGEIPWGTAGLTPSPEERNAIEEELGRLDDAVDAVSDLLLAESVHQVVGGSTAGAAATLDSLSKGHRPPEPDVASMPRGGSVLHQRIALVVSEAVLPAAWNAMGPTPRAQASPELNAWLAGLLGPPDDIACTATPEGGAAVAVTVETLALQPLDLLAHAATADSGAPDADLDRRVARAVADAGGADFAVTIDYTDARGAALSLADALELLAELARTIGYARPLEPRDLLPPERESALASADLMTLEADTRADAAAAELAATVLALDAAVTAVRSAAPGTDPDLAALRDALVRAAELGISGAFPAGLHDDSAASREPLLAVADAAVAELEVRTAAEAAATTASERLRAVFGRGFPVLPRFVPADPALLAPALATEPDLGTDGDGTVEGWFSQAARVRERLDAWRQVVLCARAVDAALPRPHVVQLPLEAANGTPRWAALDYDGGEPHPSGLVSLALFGAVPAANAPWSGLLLDEWPEILPNIEEDAGVVFHFDAPGAQAPQCVLLAVPPVRTETWSYDALEETLLDTLRLAQARARDLTNLGAYGQILPMTYLAANAENATIATSFVGLAVAQATVVQGRS